jgi:hypothetical protein
MYTTLHVLVIIRPSSGGTYLIKLNLHMLQRNIFYLLTFNLHCILTYTCMKVRSKIKLILKLCWTLYFINFCYVSYYFYHHISQKLLNFTFLNELKYHNYTLLKFYIGLCFVSWNPIVESIFILAAVRT